MKIRLYIMALLGLSLIFSACKDDDTTVNPPEGDTQNYFPGSVGTYYRFVLETEDSSGNQVSGERSVRYTGTSAFNGINYIQQTDSIFVGPVSPPSVSYFRKGSDGLYYYLDTTGLGETIPDSLLQYITFSGELKAFGFPFQEGASWTVFKMTLTYLLTLDIVDVSGSVIGKENVVLNLLSGQVTKEALKVRFVMTLKVPDPQNPFSPMIQTFESFSWVVKDIGVVKWEGDAVINGVFAGSGIDFGDSTIAASQSLIDYDVK